VHWHTAVIAGESGLDLAAETEKLDIVQLSSIWWLP
jgi:hypothetical protein